MNPSRNLPRTAFHKLIRIIGIIALLLVSVMTLCAVVFTILLSRAIQEYGLGGLLNPPPPPEFCTLEDKVVQAIQASHEEWVEHFRSQHPKSGYPSILFFTLPNGKQYGVDARQWYNPTDNPVLLITTQIRWPNTAEYGNAGYFYAPENKPSVGTRLIIRQLTEDIYCYWWNYDA